MAVGACGQRIARWTATSEDGGHHRRESQIGTIVTVSTQIAVRLPDDMVAYVDELVAAGEPSRAAVVTKALVRYRRQLQAEQDAAVYRETGGYPELEEWVGDRTIPPLD